MKKVAELIRDGKFDATRVLELRLAQRQVGKRAVSDIIDDAIEVLSACTNLLVLDLSSFLVCDMAQEGNTELLRAVWRAIPPCVDTMCIFTPSYIHVVFDGALNELNSFIDTHPRLCNWKIASGTCFGKSAPRRLFEKAKLISLYGGVRSPDLLTAVPVFSEMEILVLNGRTTGALNGVAFPNLREVWYNRLRPGTDISDLICKSPKLTTFTCSVDVTRGAPSVACWAIYPRTSSLEHVILHFTVDASVDIGPFKEGIPHNHGDQICPGEELSEETVKHFVSGVTNRTSFPRLKKITIVCTSRAKPDDMVRRLERRKVFEENLRFLGTEDIQLVFASRKHQILCLHCFSWNR